MNTAAEHVAVVGELEALDDVRDQIGAAAPVLATGGLVELAERLAGDLGNMVRRRAQIVRTDFGRQELIRDLYENFFDNAWDPGFGAAVLAGDYAGLAACSPDVPDATTAGCTVKMWERGDDGIFLIKAALCEDGVDLEGARLASELCAALFDEGRSVPLDIVERFGRPCSATSLMIAGDEELINGNRLCTLTGLRRTMGENGGNRITKEQCNAIIEAFESIGVADASAHVARMACCSCLGLLADFHPGNFGVIRKVGASTWRAAPIFDYEGSFGILKDAGTISRLYTDPHFVALACAFCFSYLDPSWDWSWYDPRALEGFEERIEEAYAPYRSLPPQFGSLIAGLFTMQRDYVGAIALQQAPAS